VRYLKECSILRIVVCLLKSRGRNLTVRRHNIPISIKDEIPLGKASIGSYFHEIEKRDFFLPWFLAVENFSEIMHARVHVRFDGPKNIGWSRIPNGDCFICINYVNILDVTICVCIYTYIYIYTYVCVCVCVCVCV